MFSLDIRKLIQSCLFLSLLGIVSIWSNEASARPNRRPAAIPKDIIQLQPPAAVAFAPELIYSYNYVKSNHKAFDPSEVLPLDLTPTNDSNAVFSRVADRGLSSFFNSAELRATPFGQTATTVEKKMKQDVIVGDEGKTQHKFTFQVQAFQSIARIDYAGFTHATIKYIFSQASTSLEIWEKVFSSKELVLSHVAKNDDRISSVGLRWYF